MTHLQQVFSFNCSDEIRYPIRLFQSSTFFYQNRRKATDAEPLTPEEEEARLERWAQEVIEKVKAEKRARAKAHAAPTPSDGPRLSPAWEYYWRAYEADEELQQLIAAERANNPNPWDAATLDPECADECADELNTTGATTPDPEPINPPISTTTTTQSLRWLNS
jgi:hypothetical protein